MSYSLHPYKGYLNDGRKGRCRDYTQHTFMRMTGNELYVEVQNFGFCFGVDVMRKRNYVHPAFLSFFNIEATPCHMNTSDEIVPDDGIIHLENIEPMNFSDAFHYCGKKLALCNNNKLRICRMYRITFECEDRIQTLLFVVDKSLTVPGLLGKSAMESPMK